jgi:glycerol-3-phosphate acyltransferase PlsY
MIAGHLLAGAVGYLIGMVPTAWLLYRMVGGGDLTKMGSGNIGARNVYDVTGKKWLGVLVMVLDALKGVAAVLVGRLIGGDDFMTMAWCAVMSVVGHNFNILLKGKGGRGLATAMGVCLAANPMFLVTWWLMYLMGYYVIRRNVHVGSMTATLASVVLMFSVPDLALIELTLMPVNDPFAVRLFAAALSVPIFIRHIGPIREVVQSMQAEDSDGES